jgi:hypothetical protein
MIRIGQRIRLTRDERAFLDGLVQERVAPRSVEDYNAWLEHALRDLSESDPEERLFKRTLERMKIGG